jgi:hypothetical protein
MSTASSAWMVEARCITTKRRVAGVDRHCATRPGAVLIVEGLWVPGTRAGLRGLMELRGSEPLTSVVQGQSAPVLSGINHPECRESRP